MTALTFPRTMPAAGPAQQVFEPWQVNLSTAETGGALYSVNFGLKRWKADWTLGKGISTAVSDEWRAFLASLSGAGRTFLGYDYERPSGSKLYPAGFEAAFSWDGDCASWSTAIDTASGLPLLSLGGLPAGLQISLGDYCGFRWETLGVERRHMVRFLEAATADGSGAITDVAIVPGVFGGVVPEDATAHLFEPRCVMRLMQETQVTAMDRRRVAGARIVALQDLRA